MQKISRLWMYVLTLLVLPVSQIVNATESTDKYTIVFDAGSSKTRAYLYKVSEDGATQVAASGDSKALSSFSSNPGDAGAQAIVPSLEELAKKATVSRDSLTVNVLGTAGMRQLSEPQQKAIYDNVEQSIKQDGYKTARIGTIAGWEEGTFAWAHLNQLAGTLGTDKTLGIVEVGGASAQITFDAKDANLAGTHAINIKGKTYYLWSESLLGFGANSVRAAMDKNEPQQTCYPAGYESSTGFNFSSCDQAYDKVFTADSSAIDILKKTADIPAIKETSFVGLSSLNYTLNFFDNQEPKKESLKQNIVNDCKSYNNINELIKSDPTKDKYDPQFKCANGAFAYNLIYDYLKLNDGALKGVKTYKNEDIRWTAGYLLLPSQ